MRNNNHLQDTLAEKALQVSDWDEKAFLGAAVGILVTVILAAMAALVLVIIRNRRKSLSELSRYSNTSMDSTSSIEQEYQSTMGSQGRFARLEHQDMAIDTTKDKDWDDPDSETSKNYTSPSVLRYFRVKFTKKTIEIQAGTKQQLIIALKFYFLSIVLVSEKSIVI